MTQVKRPGHTTDDLLQKSTLQPPRSYYLALGKGTIPTPLRGYRIVQPSQSNQTAVRETNRGHGSHP